MDSILSYDSKLIQMLLKLADLIILNLLFILCCIPIVTIGAAQTGLHSAITQMQKKHDDGSVYTAFFKGFRNGFVKITLVHTLGLLLVLVLVWAAGIAIQLSGNTLPSWMCVIAVITALLFHSMLTLFHAHFDCTAKQLVKNVYLMTLAHPLRAMCVMLLTWIPFLALILDPINLFLRPLPLWFMLYYSMAFLFCHSVMKKPFDGLKEDFAEAQRLAAEGITDGETTDDAHLITDGDETDDEDEIDDEIETDAENETDAEDCKVDDDVIADKA